MSPTPQPSLPPPIHLCILAYRLLHPSSFSVSYPHRPHTRPSDHPCPLLSKPLILMHTCACTHRAHISSPHSFPRHVIEMMYFDHIWSRWELVTARGTEACTRATSLQSLIYQQYQRGVGYNCRPRHSSWGGRCRISRRVVVTAAGQVLISGTG